MVDRTMEELLQEPTEGESSSKTDDRIDKLADQISNLVEIVNKQVITPATVKAVEKSCVICGGAHDYYNCIATDSTLSSNTIPNPKGEMKAVTTRSGLAYEGLLIPTNSSLEKVVERETVEIMDKEQPNCQRSIAHIQPLVFPTSIPKPGVSKNQPKPNIPYPSRLNDQKLQFKNKLFELSKVPLNENCSAMLPKKLLEKLGDPEKFLISCDFPRMDACHALADLGTSINLMPLSIWKKLSLPELTPTQMTLKLADRSITRPKGVAEDVFIKVGKFHFPTDFVVVDFEADPRVPLILGRSFLRTGRALIYVYVEEITLWVNDESIFLRKLKTHWSGPFTINQVFPYGTVELSQLDGPNFKVNGHRVKHYYSEDIPSKLRDNALVVLGQNIEKAKHERNDLKLKLEKFQTSSKNLSELLASQTNDKPGLGYNSQVFTRAMFDYDDYLTFESDESLPPSLIYDRYQSGNGYHAVPPPYTGTFIPPKPDLVFHNAPNDVETDHPAFNIELSPTKPDNDLSHTHRPLAPIIYDWVSDSEDESETKTPQNVPSFVQPTKQVKSPRPSNKHVESSIPTDTPKTTIPKPTSNDNRRNRKACFVCKSLDHLINDSVVPKSKLVPINAARPITAVVLKINVTRPRQDKLVVTKTNSPPRRHINRSPSPKVTAVKAPKVNVAQGVQGKWECKTKMSHLRPCFLQYKCINDPQKGNPQHALKDKGVIDSGCSRHMTGNMSYLSDFEEVNGGYVAFGGNPKGGKISGKGKIRTAPDENQVLLRVPMENNMYNVDLKNIVSSRDLTCLFTKATLDESNLWHRRLGHINFKTLNKLVKGIENLHSLKMKIIKSDNGIKFKNNDLNRLCGMKGIKREFSVPRTPQQNGIVERKNRTSEFSTL
nr:hypothetical protein [Tanacetum cinerariifolium]